MSKTNGKAASIDALRGKVWQIRDALAGSLAERTDAIDCVMTAFVCQEHVVFEGPPGTAKSLMSDGLMRCIDGGNYVRRLLHKFMVADELIGPMDLAHFKKHNVFRRALANGACDAHGLFLDEIFKANGALLNTLLTLLEERQYADQSGSMSVPLRMAVSASNEFPQEAVLAALYDRFLFRCRVNYIALRGNKRDLLLRKAGQAKVAQAFTPPCTITVQEWDTIAADVDTVTVPEALIDKLLDFQNQLAKDGMLMSDRRSVKVLRAIKAAAWLDGDAEATVDHLHVLRFCAWDTPEELEKVNAAVKTLERSATRTALDEIDAALRTFNALPTEPNARNEALGNALTAITTTGHAIKARIAAGEFTKRGVEKVTRRAAELKKAYETLQNEVQL